MIFLKTLDAFTQFSVIEFFVTRTLSVSPTDHCFTAVATSLCVIFKQLADDRLTNNDSSSHVKNANKLLIKFDCCSLFYSPIGSVFIKQQKLYSNATWCLELIFDLEAECCDGEGRSKPSIDDFRSIWQRDSTRKQMVCLLFFCFKSHSSQSKKLEIGENEGNFWELITSLAQKWSSQSYF